MTAGLFLTLGYGLVAWVRLRHDTGHRAFRRFTVGYVVALAGVCGLSLASNVEESRCPDDPTEVCRYNDSVPAIAFVAGVYLIVATIAARIVYTER